MFKEFDMSLWRRRETMKSGKPSTKNTKNHKGQDFSRSYGLRSILRNHVNPVLCDSSCSLWTVFLRRDQFMAQEQYNADERAFAFLHINERQTKPRARGVTEIRGPYYTPMGKRYLQDVLETMGAYVDSLKFAGGSFSLMP